MKVLFVFNDPFLREELEAITWNEGYRFIVFKGDWFTTKYNAEKVWAEEKVILYFEQFSPLKQKELQSNFPLLDVLVANREFEAEDYAAYMQQYGLPQSMGSFVEKNIRQLQSDRIYKLLQPYYTDGSISVAVACRAFLSFYLGQKRVLEWDELMVQVLLLGRNSEETRRQAFFKKLQGVKMVAEALERQLRDIFGVAFDYNTAEKVGSIIRVLKYNAITQKLAPVEADDYKHLRISDALHLQRLNILVELALTTSPYAKAFWEVIDELGKDVRDEAIIRWYGAEADYSLVSENLCISILRTLMKQYLETEPRKVVERIEGLILKAGNKEELKQPMAYVLQVACFYEQALSLGTLRLDTPDKYIQKYDSTYYLIDGLYRQSTDIYYDIGPENKLFEDIQQVKQRLDMNYAKLANHLNLEWVMCVRDLGGFKALNLLRQQDFYETQIKPVHKKVAVIVSDALRYEMAKELIQELAKTRHIAKLSPALAMLPTETKYCKPALLPHKDLALVESEGVPNMTVDGKVLEGTDKRSAHVDGYREGALCVAFDEIAKYDTKYNREIFKHPLVYIFHDAIDKVGHSGLPKQIVNECKEAIKDIATMVAKIHSSYNVTEVYVTADHGFLFNDMEFSEKDKHPVNDVCLERKSRYYLTRAADSISGIEKFPWAEVSGMKGATDVYVAVPQGTNRIAAPAGGYVFTHGGASLQEMIIPIIASKQERADNKEAVGVQLLNSGNLKLQSSRLRCNLIQTEAVGMGNKERTITVGLYQHDTPVSPLREIPLNKTDAQLDNRKIPVDLRLTTKTDAKVLQLKVFDVEDIINPLIKENVMNNTLIETDFDY